MSIISGAIAEMLRTKKREKPQMTKAMRRSTNTQHRILFSQSVSREIVAAAATEKKKFAAKQKAEYIYFVAFAHSPNNKATLFNAPYKC